MVDINEYTRETTCEYKGEVYSVRDNGAVMGQRKSTGGVFYFIVFCIFAL